MANKQTYNSTTITQVLNPIAVVNGTDTGTSVDQASNHYQDAIFIVNAGLWTDGVHTITAEDSPDDSVWTTVVAADLDGTFTVIDGAPDDNIANVVGYLGAERYLRMIIVTTGATIGAVIGCAILQGSAATLPTN